LHRSCRQRKHADKLKAILLLNKGASCVEVGEILLLDDDTIRTYRNSYLSKGAASLLSDNNNNNNNNNRGTSAFLSRKQLDALENHLRQNVYADSKGILALVEKEFGIKYTASRITNLLKRLGFAYKKPILIPCKANIEKQEEFVKRYN
jgi:transposase